ncbi:MAG TPA: hypothetical protein VFV19_03175 [Candidatus Polarisedimenticolaceae bacterium]|nr:hypothetical protein [Candidatus Polarisedimenticolaceae bacterium]
MATTIAPLADVPGWLATDPPGWAADAHRETLQVWQGSSDDGKTRIRGVLALNEEGDTIGVATCTDPLNGTGERPRLIFVQRDKDHSYRGTGYALFRALTLSVRGRPIAAVPFGHEGAPAMRGWGFTEKDGAWEYHEPPNDDAVPPGV